MKEKNNKDNSTKKNTSNNSISKSINIIGKNKKTIDSNKKHKEYSNNNEKSNDSKNYFKPKNNKENNEIGNKRKLEINTNNINSKTNFKSSILTKELSKTLPNIKNDKDQNKNKIEIISKSSKKEFKENHPNIDENIIKSTLKNEFEIEKEEIPSKKTNDNFEIFNKIISDKLSELYRIFEERFNRIDTNINDINSKIDRISSLKNNDEKGKLKEENQKLKEKINVEMSKKYILTGLKHIDKIPFINEVIQCLIHTEPLTNFFKNYYIDNNNTKFALAYKKLIDKMVDNNNKIIEEKHFVDIITELISSKQYDKMKINNIFDFIEFILLQLHEELKQEINPVICKTWNELEKQAYEKEIGKEQS